MYKSVKTTLLRRAEFAEGDGTSFDKAYAIDSKERDGEGGREGERQVDSSAEEEEERRCAVSLIPSPTHSLHRIDGRDKRISPQDEYLTILQ